MRSVRRNAHEVYATPRDSVSSTGIPACANATAHLGRQCLALIATSFCSPFVCNVKPTPPTFPCIARRTVLSELGHRPFGSQGNPFIPQGKQECLCHCEAKMDGRHCAKHRVRARHAVPLLKKRQKAKRTPACVSQALAVEVQCCVGTGRNACATGRQRRRPEASGTRSKSKRAGRMPALQKNVRYLQSSENWSWRKLVRSL